jgi:hypothetical protein
MSVFVVHPVGTIVPFWRKLLYVADSWRGFTVSP